VLDVETSGLDAAADALIAIGAVAMRADGSIVPHDSFEAVLRQAQPSSRANIAVHGLGAEAQRGGLDPGAALQALAEFAGESPVLAFHAPFDRAFVRRATREFLGRDFDNAWLDLAALAPALDPAVPARSLDEWLAQHGIDHEDRHSAAADAFVTAQIAAGLVHRARQQGASSFRDLQRLANAVRWIAR
jgi:DNA polymerase-3 subunit epsilon